MMTNIGITRSRSNKWITGVCAGLARRLGIDPLWVRIGALLLAIAPVGLGIIPLVLVYVALTVLLPEEASTSDSWHGETAAWDGETSAI